MARLYAIGLCGAALLVVKTALAPLSTTKPNTQKLVVREEANHIVLAWSGPVAPPMRDELASAFKRFEDDPRRMVISLNSPGGSVSHGREVIKEIRNVEYRRPVETLVEKGGVCASMCVPIYLQGARRAADPSALFMFHEATIDKSALRKAGAGALAIDKGMVRQIEAMATDVLYDKDIGQQRLNPKWASEMRTKIVGREIWLSAQQLTDANSGVVDAIAPALKK